MFIGHLPAGYLATTALLRRFRAPPASRRRLLALGMAASVLPDLDLFYHYLMDERRHVHHAYLTHIPGAWAVALAAAALVLSARRTARAGWIAFAVFGANVLLHLLLDSVAGGIRWLWPFSDAEFAMTEVQARHDPWYLNFVLHWSFALEIALLIVALWTYFRSRRHAARPEHDGS